MVGNKITINNNKVDGINQITMEAGETVIITITMVDGTSQVILDGVTNQTITIIIAVGQIIVVTIVVGDNSNNRAIVDGVMVMVMDMETDTDMATQIMVGDLCESKVLIKSKNEFDNCQTISLILLLFCIHL